VQDLNLREQPRKKWLLFSYEEEGSFDETLFT